MRGHVPTHDVKDLERSQIVWKKFLLNTQISHFSQSYITIYRLCLLFPPPSKFPFPPVPVPFSLSLCLCRCTNAESACRQCGWDVGSKGPDRTGLDLTGLNWTERNPVIDSSTQREREPHPSYAEGMGKGTRSTGSQHSSAAPRYTILKGKIE